ncbi:MAG: hypothetical protein ABIH38_00500 [Patescibacteria group bacterium]
MKKAKKGTVSPEKKIRAMAVIRLRPKELPEGFEGCSRENEICLKLPDVGEFTRPPLLYVKEPAPVLSLGIERDVLSETARKALDDFWHSILRRKILRKCRLLIPIFPGWVITNIIVCDKEKYRPGVDFSSLDGREYINMEVLIVP